MRTLRRLGTGRWAIFFFGVGGGFLSGHWLDGSGLNGLGFMLVAFAGLGVLCENWLDREHARGSRREADGSGPSAEFERSLPLDALPGPLPGQTPEEHRRMVLGRHRELSKIKPPENLFDEDPPRCLPDGDRTPHT